MANYNEEFLYGDEEVDQSSTQVNIEDYNEATQKLFKKEREQMALKFMGRTKKPAHAKKMYAMRTRWVDWNKEKITELKEPFENKCCFETCPNPYGEYGNNPAPFKFKPEERCCEECNKTLVMPCRIMRMKGMRTIPGHIHWLNKCNEDLTRELLDHATVSKMRNDTCISLRNYQTKYFNRAKEIQECRIQTRAAREEAREMRIENTRLQKKMEQMMDEKMKKERAEFKKQIADLNVRLAQSKRNNKKRRK